MSLDPQVDPLAGLDPHVATNFSYLVWSSQIHPLPTYSSSLAAKGQSWVIESITWYLGYNQISLPFWFFLWEHKLIYLLWFSTIMRWDPKSNLHLITKSLRPCFFGMKRGRKREEESSLPLLSCLAGWGRVSSVISAAEVAEERVLFTHLFIWKIQWREAETQGFRNKIIFLNLRGYCSIKGARGKG